MNEPNRNRDGLIESIVLTALKPRSLILFMFISAITLLSYQFTRSNTDQGTIIIYSDWTERNLEISPEIKNFKDILLPYRIDSDDMKAYATLVQDDLGCDFQTVKCIDKKSKRRVQILDGRLKIGLSNYGLLENDKIKICQELKTSISTSFLHANKKFASKVSKEVAEVLENLLVTEYKKLFFKNFYSRNHENYLQNNFSMVRLLSKIDYLKKNRDIFLLSGQLVSITECVIEKHTNTSSPSYSIMVFVFMVFVALMILIKIEFDYKS